MKSAFVAKELRQQIQGICFLAFLMKLSGSGLFGVEKVAIHADQAGNDLQPCSLYPSA